MSRSLLPLITCVLAEEAGKGQPLETLSPKDARGEELKVHLK